MGSQPLSRRAFARIATLGAPAAWLVGCEGSHPSAVPTPVGAEGASANARLSLVRSVETAEGRGARVRRIFPTRGLGYQDPFVLLDDFSVASPAGFPMHPHRGFEAFTYMLDGSFHHQDTLGNDSVVDTGGTQRFSSGRGARHSEMPVGERENRGLQLWVNLPRADKKMSPEYEAVHGRDLPEEGRNGVVVRTIVGRGSAVRLRTNVRYLDVKLERGRRFEDAVEADRSSLLYVVEGHVRVGDVELSRGEGVQPREGELAVAALDEARVVLVSGKRHHEPIVHHGPFVD